MREFYLVVEVLDPHAAQGVSNVYISLDSDETDVANGFKALKEGGQKPTGTISRAQRVNGVLERIDTFPPKVMIQKGWRTASAFLRA
jgi:hypothetical protein